MNRYDMPIPRAFFGAAAVAMTALTVASAVVLPAMLDAGVRENPGLLMVGAPVVTDRDRLRINVVGECERSPALRQVSEAGRVLEQRT
jgi:hypothetical protein